MPATEHAAADPGARVHVRACRTTGRPSTRPCGGTRRGLRTSGYYEAVVRTTPVPGQASTAIDLTVDVTRGPLVALTFEGDSLPEAARRELVPVREEASVDEDLLEDSRNRITAWLQERGYWRARVSYSRRQTPTGLEVVFTIARGRVYRVRSVVIGGVQALPEATLRQRVAIEPGDPFAPSVLSAGIASITQLYQNSGFPAARVEQALVDVSAPSLSPDVPGDLEIRLRVTEGTRATVSAHHVRGRAGTRRGRIAVRADAGAWPAFFVGRRRGEPRSRPAALPGRGIPPGTDRGAARQRRRHRCHRRDVRPRRGAPDDRRSHPRGRQRPHQRGHHPPRASHRQGAALRPQPGVREPAAPHGPGPVPQRPDCRRRSGQRRFARRRHHGRGSAGHDGGVRRGAAGRAASAFGRRHRCRRGELRVRRARVLRGGPTQPVGEEPRRQPLRAGERSTTRLPGTIPNATAADSRSTSTACSARGASRARSSTAPTWTSRRSWNRRFDRVSASGDSRRAWTGRGCSASTSRSWRGTDSAAPTSSMHASPSRISSMSIACSRRCGSRRSPIR